MAMILHFTFEELSALDAAIERVLDSSDTGGVAAPPQVLTDLESLAPRLVGDISVDSLAEQLAIQKAIEFLLAETRDRTDSFILDEHPAAESAVRAYFEYAHILTVLERIRQMGEEMKAIVSLMTGEAPSDETARSVSFED
jgi:lipoate synthase